MQGKPDNWKRILKGNSGLRNEMIPNVLWLKSDLPNTK